MKTAQVHKIEEGNQAKYVVDRSIADMLHVSLQKANIATPPLQLSAIVPENLPVAQEFGKRGIAYYTLEKDSALAQVFDNVLKRLTETITGGNKVGEIIGALKDVSTFIFPIMGPVDDFTDRITNLIDQEAENHNLNSTIMKNKTQSKTWWGIVAKIIGLILLAFGIVADPSFLADGFQLAADLELLIGFILTVAGQALETWGLRTAKTEIR